MTLDEAIAHAEERSKNCTNMCQLEHMQLALWLRELRLIREKFSPPNGFRLVHVNAGFEYLMEAVDRLTSMNPCAAGDWLCEAWDNFYYREIE